MANLIGKFELEGSAKLMAAQDGRVWEELPDSVKEMYIDKSVQRGKDLWTECGKDLWTEFKTKQDRKK